MPINEDNNDIDNNLDEQIDDVNLFEDFEGGEPDVDGREPSKPSETMTKNLLAASSAFTKTAATEVAESLPKTKGLLSELIDVKDSFDEFKKEFKEQYTPTINEVRKAMYKSMPMAKRYIPKALYDKIEKALSNYKEEVKEAQKTQAEKQSEYISQSIAEIFAAQEDIRTGEREEDRVTDMVEQVTQATRHAETKKILANVSNSLYFQNQFIKTTKTAWMKKMLELQYISVYTQRESLSTLKIQVSMLETKLEELKHNNALPDWQKWTLTDRKDRLVRQSQIGLAMKAAPGIKNYISTTGKNLVGTLRKSTTGFMTGLRQQASLAGATAETAAMMPEDSGPGTGIGRFIGGLGGKFAGRSLADRLLPIIESIEAESTSIKDTAFFKSKRLKERLEGKGSVGASLLASLLPAYTEDMGVENELLASPTEPVPLDRAMRQAVVEIIPAYLSKIAKYTKDTATGRNNEEEVYDVVQRKIVTKSEAAKSAQEQVFGKEGARAQQAIASVGKLRAGFERNVGAAADIGQFDQYMPQFLKFMNNAAIRNEIIHPEMIRQFAEGDPDAAKSDYIEKTFSGVKNPRAVAQALTMAIYGPDGKVDRKIVRQLESSMAKSASAKTWRERLPQMLEAQGAYGLFKDTDLLSDEGVVSEEELANLMSDVSRPDFEKQTRMTGQATFASLAERERQEETLRSEFAEKYRGVRRFGRGVAKQLRMPTFGKLAKSDTGQWLKRQMAMPTFLRAGKATAAGAGKFGKFSAKLSLGASKKLKEYIKDVSEADNKDQLERIMERARKADLAEEEHQALLEYAKKMSITLDELYDPDAVQKLPTETEGETKYYDDFVDMSTVAKANARGRMPNDAVEAIVEFKSVFVEYAAYQREKAESVDAIREELIRFHGVKEETDKRLLEKFCNYFDNSKEIDNKILDSLQYSNEITEHEYSDDVFERMHTDIRLLTENSVESLDRMNDILAAAELNLELNQTRNTDLKKMVPKKVFGDTDMDNIREGSYADYLKERQGKGGAQALLAAGMMPKGGSGPGGKPTPAEIESGIMDSLMQYGPLVAALGIGATTVGGQQVAGRATGIGKIINTAQRLGTGGMNMFRGSKLGTRLMGLGSKASGLYKGFKGTRAFGLLSRLPGMGTLARAKQFAGFGLKGVGGIGKGASALGRAAGPLTALAEIAYGAGKTGFDSEAAEEHLMGNLSREEALKERMGLLGRIPGSGVSRQAIMALGLDKYGQNWRESGVIKGTAKNVWESLGVFQHLGKNIGTAGNLAVDTVQEFKGPEEYRLLIDALKKQEIVKDPWGWGDWQVQDWNAIGALPERDLRTLYGQGEKHFSDEDLERFKQFYIAKSKKRRKRERQAKEEAKAREEAEKKAEQQREMVKQAEKARMAEEAKRIQAKTVADATGTTVADTYQTPSAATAEEAKKVATAKAELAKRPDEAQQQTLEEMRKQSTALMATAEGIQAIVDNTGKLGDIKEGIDEVGKGVKEPKAVIVNQESENKKPKVQRPAIDIMQSDA